MRNLKPIHALWLCAVLLAGCESVGLITPKSFTEQLAYTHATVNSVVASTTNALNAGAIHSSDAEYVQKLAVETRTLLSAAQVAFTGGDTSTAEGRLQLAQAILKELQAYLVAREIS